MPPSLLVLERRHATTTWLSQWHRTCRPCHAPPHAAHAKTMGSSSFWAIPSDWDFEPHWSWNYDLPCHAPQDPDASVVSSMRGR